MSSNQRLVIRDATVLDADDIAALNADAWKIAFRGVMTDSFLDSYEGRRDGRRQDLINMTAQDHQFVVVDDTDLVGWLYGHPNRDSDAMASVTYEIGACYVAPRSWRQGIGATMIAEIRHRLRSTTWESIVVWTPKYAEHSNRFYLSQGFELDGSERNYELDIPIPLVRYRQNIIR